MHFHKALKICLHVFDACLLETIRFLFGIFFYLAVVPVKHRAPVQFLQITEE